VRSTATLVANVTVLRTSKWFFIAFSTKITVLRTLKKRWVMDSRQKMGSGNAGDRHFASAGRYGGTYAHQTIAIEFMMWLNPLFKLHWIQNNRETQSLLEHLFEQWNRLDKLKNPNIKQIQLPNEDV
jgi:KilA-N domain